MYTFRVVLTHPTEGDMKTLKIKAHDFAETESKITTDYEDWNIYSITRE